jgi:ATP-dependent metalloprotease FtsH
MNYFISLILLLFFFNVFESFILNVFNEISITDFKDIIYNSKNNSLLKINEINIYDMNKAYIYKSYNISTNSTVSILNLPNYNFIETEFIPILKENNIPYFFRVNYLSIFNELFYYLQIILLFIFIKNLFANNNMFSIFNNKINIINNKNTSLDKKMLSDIYGMKEVKEQIEEFIDFFKNKDKLKDIGCRPIKGILFVGPPGTGKTYFAKTIANELKMSFINTSGSSFNEVYVGLGASRVREMFENARKNKPCIIFIDEIDAIGHIRKSDKYKDSGSDENDNTLNALLVEMDGFSSNNDIFVIGSTNRGDLLDPALTRTGRFDRKIYFDLPELNDRKEIFKGYLLKYKYFTNNLDELVDKLAKQTTGCNCSDLENIVNEAGILCVRRNQIMIEEIDLINAIDQVLIGRKRVMRILPEEKEIIAYHEAGHTILQYLLKYLTNPVKVTIIPQGKAALGFTKSEANELKLMNYKQLIHELVVLYGGFLTEELIFGFTKVTSGASNDIERATEIIKAMIGKYGMTEKVGLINMDNDKLDINYIIEISKRIRNITKILLEKNMENIEIIKNLLLEKETIYLRDLIEVLGENKINSKEVELII